MTRTTYFVKACFVLLFVLSLLQGCGGTEEPPSQEAAGSSDFQTKEQKESSSVKEIAEIPPSKHPVERAGESEASESSDEIVIENPGYESDKKKAVKLSHKRHSEEYGIACDSCHHVYQEGENLWKQGDPVHKCVECHDPVEDQGNAIKLQRAFHKNCRDCHKEVTQEGREAPYKKCADCHG
jgi:hypothetical protein